MSSGLAINFSILTINEYYQIRQKPVAKKLIQTQPKVIFPFSDIYFYHTFLYQF